MKSATRDQKYDFVYFKIKEKGKYHPITMWKEYEIILKQDFQIEYNDLLKTFEELKDLGHIYKGNDNEYRIHPNSVDFMGFELQSRSIKKKETMARRFSTAKIIATLSIALISVIVSIVLGVCNNEKNLKIDKLQSQVDSLQKVQKQSQIIDSTLNKHHMK